MYNLKYTIIYLIKYAKIIKKTYLKNKLNKFILNIVT